MADYAEGVNLDTPIPSTPAAFAWKAGVALDAADTADKAGLAGALRIVGLDRDDVLAGRAEVKQ